MNPHASQDQAARQLLIRAHRNSARIELERGPEAFRYYHASLGTRTLLLTLSAAALTLAEAETIRRVIIQQLREVQRELYGRRPRRPRQERDKHRLVHRPAGRGRDGRRRAAGL